jgi:hypothetical protein
LLTTLLTTPVELLVAVTVTPAMIAAEGSVMVPLKLALPDWPNALMDTASDTSSTITLQ